VTWQKELDKSSSNSSVADVSSSGYSQPIKETVCQEANRIIHGAREEAYGTPAVNFDRLAKMWSIILETDITPEKVILCFIATKVARQIQTTNRDGMVDIAGYAGCWERLYE
jgi:hypothetical protein